MRGALALIGIALGVGLVPVFMGTSANGLTLLALILCGASIGRVIVKGAPQ